MKAYQKEIEKLIRLRDMIRQDPGPQKQYPFVLSVKLKNTIALAVDDFERINDMYDQNTHNSERIKENGCFGFIQLATIGSEYLQSQYSKIKNSKLKIHKTVVDICQLIENDNNNNIK
jgi:hypothetical protein